ncbi:hypothetical protein acdb102_07660 [Acidothermaceae bacterium B102]|nr:hypothetical protein acdb102_07660 [Acidothermaceae bacterium B102]
MRELRRILVRRAVGVVVLLGLTMLRLLTDLGLRPAVATELYLLAVTAVALFWCFQLLARLETSDRLWSRAARRPDLDRRPDRLVSLEESVTFWVRTSYTRHRRLRPAVQGLVRARLSRSGIDLDRDPRAPAVLGRTAWHLVHPDAPAPKDDDTVGLTDAQIDDLARTLTALGTQRTMTGEQH